MKIFDLNAISHLYFGYEDAARVLGIGMDSAKVAVHRYAKRGLVLRLKRNTYVLRERWNRLERTEKFALANIGQVPSYVSLMTALDHYHLTTQMQQEVIESVALKRTLEIPMDGNLFRYTKIRRELYSDFIRTEGYFIAVPEKALLDVFYLLSIGRYAADIDSIDAEKFNPKTIERISRRYPLKTKRMLAAHGYLKSS